MLEGLQNKWKVNGWRLVLILITFAVGGSLTGIAGKKLMAFTGIQNPLVYGILYIIIITIIWPLAVMAVSIPLGQFPFFKKYISRIGERIFNRRRAVAEIPNNPDSYRGQIPGKKQITIFASGAGSNAQKIIDHFKNSQTKIALIVCNKPGAGVIGIAKKEGIPLLLINKERFFNGDGYLPEIKNINTDLIVLAGFLWKMPATLINAFPKKIINIHPALLPKFGGKGMYGNFVHQSVINSGEVQSGITVHYVDEHYDNGDIIFQTVCPVMEEDTPESLSQRIHHLEHVHYPKVIEEVLIKN